MNRDIKKVFDTLKSAVSAIEEFESQNPEPDHLVPADQLGKLVKAERKKQKITLEVLSKLSGVSKTTISALENGKKTASYENVEKVLDALGKTLWIK